jgi:hypothetical protein
VSYTINDFTSQVDLYSLRWAGYPTEDAELEMIASTLSGDAIIHDMTITNPMMQLRVNATKTAFTNGVNIIVNKGKAGNLSGPDMAAALSGATPPPLQMPTNITPPVISGSPTIGSVLTCDPGAWTGSPTYAYIWTRNETTIVGATGQTYTIQAIDAGSTLECEVKATNAAGSAQEGANEIQVPAVLPVNTVAPVVSGNPVVAWRLSCDTGTWSNTPTGYAYQWMSGGLPIGGAVGPDHILTDDDAGTSVSCQVIATNAQGNGVALSNGMQVVQGPPVNLTPPQASLNPTYVLCTGGAWTGNPPTYAYQWMSNSSPVSGATGATWTFAGYEGTTVYCAVTVSNAYGVCPAVDSNSVVIPEAS